MLGSLVIGRLQELNPTAWPLLSAMVALVSRGFALSRMRCYAAVRRSIDREASISAGTSLA
jgi:hypothetical protein